MAEGEDGAISFQLQTSVGKNKLTDYQLTVSSSEVTWQQTRAVDDKSNAIGIKCILISKSLETGPAEKNKSTHKLDIHHSASAGDSKDKYRLCHKVTTFYGEKMQCDACSEKIARSLRTIRPIHPRRLLIIINPISGSGTGVKMYHKKVRPLIEIAEIQTDVIITEHANHSDAILDHYDLASIHGIVSVGGDGTFREVASALLKRLTKEAGTDPNDEGTALPHPTLPVGILPLGSGNALAFSFFRSRDLITAALGIIMGAQCMKSVNTVHSDGQLLGYNFLLLAYGALANVTVSAENLRWMGPSRYMLVPMFLIRGRIPFEVEVQCLVKDNNEKKGSIDAFTAEDRGPAINDIPGTSENIMEQSQEINSMSNSPAITLEDREDGATAERKAVWQTFTGSVIGVDMFAVDLSITAMNDGSKMQEAMAAGGMSIGIMKPCGVGSYIKLLMQLQRGDTAAHDFVEYITGVTAYRFRALGEEYKQSKEGLRISHDGDVIPIPAPNISVRCQADVLRAYCIYDDIECHNK